MAETFLDRIRAATRRRVAIRSAAVGLDVLEAQAAQARRPRAFAAALRPTRLGPASLIGEVKRASPSKGLLAERFDPVAQARAYEAGGAAAISVVTEPDFFLGSLQSLEAVSTAVGVPVLCKDFILADYQVYEARAAGADAILLICDLVDDGQLAHLLAVARQLGMEALIETHNQGELERALRMQAPVIGINTRDLKTFTVDTQLVRRLGQYVPPSSILVAESGISDRRQASQARAWGADAILVGEALMRAPEAAAMARALATAAGGASAGLFGRSGPWGPFVKLCGLTLPEQAAWAAELCADAVGLVFAPSRRQVTCRQAQAIIAAAGATLPVGVFVDESPAAIAEIAERLHLGAVQLSGNESVDVCAEVATRTNVVVIKAIRPTSGATAESPDATETADAYALAGTVLLVDTPSRDGRYGGTGRIGDWHQAHRLAERWPVILSGGLTPHNLPAALAAVGPSGVDVSSGIETNGTKDLEKMRAFVEAAHAATIPAIPATAEVDTDLPALETTPGGCESERS